MEEFDDLVPTPDEDGGLELSYRGWSLIDDVVWTMGRELVSLNVSFNAIEVEPHPYATYVLVRIDFCFRDCDQPPTPPIALRATTHYSLSPPSSETCISFVS